MVFLCRLKGMAQEMDRLQGAQRLRDTQWTGKEQSYKKTVEQLETKVDCLYNWSAWNQISQIVIKSVPLSIPYVSTWHT